MNTYDFDKTVFYPDSSFCFFLYCLRRFPRITWPTLPRTGMLALGYSRKRVRAKELKEQVFSFLKDVPDIETVVSDYWQLKRGNLQDWYLRQKREDDLIISASPEFLLRPICRELGVRLIATPMDASTGRINGENCHDSEKVRRFHEEYPGERVESFYSDSLSDSPMAELAEKAYLVKKGKISPWPEK